MSKKIIFSSGGTGGHMFPAIYLMKHLSNKGYETLLVTDIRSSNYLKQYPELNSCIIRTETPTNKNFIKKILSLVVIFFSVIKSILILKKEKPNLIFGFGGYASFPISFASRFFNIPLVIYESNLVLGRTNKNLLPLSKKILLGTDMPVNFPEKHKSKARHVGNILSEEMISYSHTEKKEEEGKFSIIVLGGSQGAEVFGEIVSPVIKMLKDKGYEIEINQHCLQSQKNQLIEYYKKNKIKNNVFDFTKNILHLISLSDLAISRSGASTTAELAQTLTPYIAVPYPYSIDNHQYLNAKYYERNGCCWVMEQNNFTSTNLFNLIMEILKDKKKLKNIRESMRKYSSKNVYYKIENVISELI